MLNHRARGPLNEAKAFLFHFLEVKYKESDKVNRIEETRQGEKLCTLFSEKEESELEKRSMTKHIRIAFAVDEAFHKTNDENMAEVKCCSVFAQTFWELSKFDEREKCNVINWRGIRPILIHTNSRTSAISIFVCFGKQSDRKEQADFPTYAQENDDEA